MMMTMRRCVPAILTLSVVFTMGALAFAEPSRYTVTPKSAPSAEGAPTEYQAENPANQLRFAFPVTGMIGTPEHAGTNAWSVDFRLVGTSFDGRFVLAGPARVSASENRVDYDFGTSRVSYLNTPLGLNN